MDGASDKIRDSAAAAPDAGWMPVRVLGDEVEWTWFGDRRLTDGFYEVDARRARWANPEPRTTRLGDLAAHAAAAPALEPDGFVFHMSRCGSTLTSRMLGAPEGWLSISEAPPLDAVVRRKDPELLRAMVRALGRVRNAETRLFVKLDCWHTLDLPLFREAFPDTPWVFLYREPTEVLASHAKAAGIQMVAEYFPAEFWGLMPSDHPFGPAWHATVLAAICEAAARQPDGLFVNYRELPEAVFTRVLPHFGVEPSAEARAAMAEIAGLDAKGAAGAPFVAAKPTADDALHEAAAGRLRQAYDALEALSRRPWPAPPPPRP